MKRIVLFLLIFVASNGLFAQATSKRAYKKQIELHRQHYKQEFLEDERSPFHDHPEGLKKLKFYKPEPDYRCNCEFTRTPEAKPFLMATYSGKTRDYVRYGRLKCRIQEQEIELSLYRNLKMVRMPGYKDLLFLPFKDSTNGEGTYGGGRYIDLQTTDIIDKRVVVDFNKCYNPWCAYSDGYNCPVPPAENHLTVGIRAGEKHYGK